MFECIIYETHHIEKVDSPSGTAIELKEIIEKNDKSKIVSSINIESERISNINGIHEVKFSNNTDLVTFKHEALSRNIFSDGAIAVAKSITKKEPNLYSVKDFFK
jgi:4-hydroxy-tetrahydrodipicolinate reductase